MRALTAALALLLPHHGVLVPGKSLGGVRLGMSKAQVEHAWGTRFGRCRGCAQETWYFNYRAFRPQGAAVRFARGRVDAAWTLWKPDGWRTRNGISIAAPQSVLLAQTGPLVTIQCGAYRALIQTVGRVTTTYYVYGQSLWGFGLSRPGAAPCH